MKSTRKKLKNISVEAKDQEVKLHCSCKTLILDSFIKAQYEDDYSGLIITGKPTPEQLQAVWNEIVVEYAVIIKTDDQEALFLLQKEILLLDWHINFVDSCCRAGDENTLPGILHFRYDNDLIIELTILGYKLSAQFGTEEYRQELAMIISLCKRKVLDLEESRDVLDRLQNTNTGNVQSEESFSLTLAMLSKYQGYRVDKMKITVEEFCSIYKNFVAEIKHLHKHEDS